MIKVCHINAVMAPELDGIRFNGRRRHAADAA